MNSRLKGIVLTWFAPVLLGSVAGLIGAHYLPESTAALAARQAAIVPAVHFAVVSQTLPAGESTFPPGPGAEIANANCVMCHSTGMILRQPPLTISEWTIEINKMRSAFGAPITPDQIDSLARYLGTVNGRQQRATPSGIDNEAS
ncbi:cytochrome c (plasmid) [Burkholderia sp. M6-3]